MSWICPTKPCFERQMEWIMYEDDGKTLFYLPTPKLVELEEAIASKEYGFITIGGARSAAKSHGIRMIAIRYARKLDNFGALIIRREMPQLRRNHAKRAVKEAKRIGAKYGSSMMTFPATDSEIEFAHCHEPEDWKNYVGAEVDLLIFEQIEQFTRTQVVEITASVGRVRRRDWRGLQLNAENPGGPLAEFVSEFYIEKNPDPEKYPDYDPTQYHFVRAQLEDNPYTDPNYVNSLALFDKERRDMNRFGARDVFPGQFFKRFKQTERRINVPRELQRVGALRFGYNRTGIYLWCVPLPDDRLYIEKELVFDETAPADLAILIRAHTATLGWDLLTTYGTCEIVDGDGLGEDTAETLAKFGLPVQTVKHDAVNGWIRMRHWLRPMSGDGLPALIVNPDCKHVLKTIPQLIEDPEKKDDILKNQQDEAAIAIRHLVMGRIHPLDNPKEESYPDDSAGKMKQDLVNSSRLILGRFNVHR